MGRKSKVQKLREEAFSVLSSLQGKIDGRTLSAYYRSLGKYHTELKVGVFLEKLKEIKSGVDSQISLLKQEGKKKKELVISSNTIKVLNKQATNRINKERSDKLKLKNKNFKVVTGNILNSQDEFLNNIRNELKKNKGKAFVLKYIVDGEVIIDKSFSVGSNFSGWWKDFSRNTFWKNSSDYIFADFLDDDNNVKGSVFLYPEDLSIPTEILVQNFKEGVTNCVFTPIKKWVISKLADAKSKQTLSRYNILLKKVNNYLLKYHESGVPENDFPEICNNLQIDINVELPFCDNKYIEAKCIKKKLKAFNFMNTRLNHIDLNEIFDLENSVEVSKDEIYDIKKDLDDRNIFYTYRRNNDTINSIQTLDKNYRVKNPFSEAVASFEFETGLKYCKIDDIDDAELSAFIKRGTHYNESVEFRPFEDKFNHIDQSKAYTKFRMCKFYEGFLGKITDFRATDKIEGVGLYRIIDLDFSCGGKFVDYNYMMNIYVDNNTYTSAELKFLDCVGIKYKIVAGCWGVKPFEFDFSQEMIEGKTELGISYYAKYAGMCDSHNLEKRFWINCDKEYFSVIKKNCGEVARWFDNGEATICFPKKHNYHLGHITAFITAYQRLQVIEQLLEFDIDDVYKVCVDGIFFRGNCPVLKNCFRVKEGNTNFTCPEDNHYCSNITMYPVSDELAPYRKGYKRELHLGAGGCGKTHYNCNDKGLVRTLFLAPSWKLAVCKKKECDIACSVWARAISDDPEKINFIKERANTLIIDEVSMMSEGQKQFIFETYSDMKLIFCGDIGFQLPCIEGDEIKIDGFDNIQYHEKDYRSQDIELNNIKKDLRKMISDKKDKFIINRWCVNQFSKLGRCVNKDFVADNYKVEDMILTSTNMLKDYYTGLFPNLKKYYVLENNRLYCNGEIVIGDEPEKTRCEIRHAFTCHSIQGETAYAKLYIDSNKMFDSRMFYTAISRAKRLDQIFIITDRVENSGLCKDCGKSCGKYYRCYNCHISFSGGNIYDCGN